MCARAIEGGRLPALKVLHLGGNPAPREMVLPSRRFVKLEPASGPPVPALR